MSLAKTFWTSLSFERDQPDSPEGRLPRQLWYRVYFWLDNCDPEAVTVGPEMFQFEDLAMLLLVDQGTVYYTVSQQPRTWFSLDELN